MKFACLAFTCLLSSLMISSVLAGEIEQTEGCNPIGRIIESYDSGIPAYSKLCADGKLIVGDRLKVKISCFGQANNRWIKGGSYSVNQLCNENRAARSACWFVDCERSPEKITLLSPRSSTVLATPQFEWLTVDDASMYEILITSHLGRIFQDKTHKPQFQIPDSYQFTPGESYEIKIFATTANRILTEGTFTIRMLGNQERLELENTLTRIENSKIPDLEKIQLMDSVYISSGLVERSIKHLEKTFTISGNTMIAALLADRYAEINDYIKARKYYEIVVQQQPETSEDFKFANKMLMRIAAVKRL